MSGNEAATPMRVARIAGFLCALFAACTSHAANPPREVPLWPEGSRVLQQGIDALAGRKFAVTHPSFLLYAPKAESTRAAILVFPGGGFKALAIGPESTIGPDGAHVCEWLTDAGITCILVKYRVPDTGCNWDWETRTHHAPAIPMALQDAQRALSLVRYHARDYGIDPDRIGVMGFSAGGNLAVLSSTAFNARAYAPIDAIDRVSLRPDFAIPVYPGHMTMEHKNKRPKAVAAQELNTDIVVSPDVPPTLLVHARDDTVDPVHYSQVYERELKKAGVDVTLLLYETGGHAFGVRKQGKDTDRWTDDALRWLQRIGIR
jgi:acetyl esterase/lipase